VAIELPMPDRPAGTRRSGTTRRRCRPPSRALAEQTAGLRLIQLASIVASEAPQG
jgi:hypothetical protein